MPPVQGRPNTPLFLAVNHHSGRMEMLGMLSNMVVVPGIEMRPWRLIQDH